MVTFLDTGLLDVFANIFMFLIVYAVSWGILSSREPLGKNPGVYALISLVLGFFVLVSEPVKRWILIVAPWYVALAILFMLIILAVSMFSKVNWTKVIEDPVARTWLILLVVLIAIIGAAFAFGQSALEGTVPAENPETGQTQPVMPQGPTGQTGSGDFEANFINTLFHPQVLGLMLIFILGAVIVFFLSKPSA